MSRFKQLVCALVFCIFTPMVFAEPLDINTATAEELQQTLTGVGKVKAQAIVQDREKNGKFKSVDDLTRVKGIGAATMEKNRSKLTVGSESLPAQPAISPPPPQEAGKPPIPEPATQKIAPALPAKTNQ